MASTTMAVSASSIAVAPQQMPATGLASKSSVCVNVLPVRSQSQVAVRRSVIVRASAEEAPMQRVVKGMVAASAAAALLFGSGYAIAAEEPGTDAERVAEKADDLLTQADKLVTDDSPERFGPGRVPGEDKSSILSQQGGSGPKPEVQGVTTPLESFGQKASDLVGSAKSETSDLAKQADVGDLSKNVDAVTKNVTENVPSADDITKIVPTADDAAEKSKGFFGSLFSGFGK
jgi:hypothetical protein